MCHCAISGLLRHVGLLEQAPTASKSEKERTDGFGWVLAIRSKNKNNYFPLLYLLSNVLFGSFNLAK